MDLGWGFSENLETDSGLITRGEFSKTDSLSDYDLVFIDPEKIDQLWTNHLTPRSDGKYRTNPDEDGGLARGLRNLMKARRKEAVNLLEKTGGAIFCKLRKPGRELTVLTREEEEELNRYSWLPKPADNLLQGGRVIEARGGSQLVPRDISSPVVTFLREFWESISYEAVISTANLPNKESFDVLSKTPSGDVISFGFVSGRGSLIFLPSRMELEVPGEQKLIEVAEKVVTGGAYHRPPWLDKYSLPAERDIKNEVKEINQEVTRLEKQKEEKKEKLRDIDCLKGLLSSRTDYELKTSLSRALEAAGFDVKEGDSGVDLMVTDSEDVNLAITVGANSEGPVGLTPYHRLVQGINELKIFKNEDPQGVTVVNGFGKLDPTDREDQLEEELIEGCNLYGFTVVTAKEIFERIKEIKKSKVGSRESLIELFEGG